MRTTLKRNKRVGRYGHHGTRAKRRENPKTNRLGDHEISCIKVTTSSYSWVVGEQSCCLDVVDLFLVLFYLCNMQLYAAFTDHWMLQA